MTKKICHWIYYSGQAFRSKTCKGIKYDTRSEPFDFNKKTCPYCGKLREVKIIEER